VVILTTTRSEWAERRQLDDLAMLVDHSHDRLVSVG
jgi:hypothetical protein